MVTELAKVNTIIDKYPPKQSVLIQLLLDIQGEFNWISQEAIQQISERLEIPVSQIYRVASFYKAMSLTPRGKHVINVCMGTACHVRGATRIIDKLEESLGIGPGETTEDRNFTLERVNCLGCCALGRGLEHVDRLWLHRGFPGEPVHRHHRHPFVQPHRQPEMCSEGVGQLVARGLPHFSVHAVVLDKDTFPDAGVGHLPDAGRFHPHGSPPSVLLLPAPGQFPQPVHFSIPQRHR